MSADLLAFLRLLKSSPLLMVVVGLPLVLFYGAGPINIAIDKFIPHSDADVARMLKDSPIKGGLLQFFRTVSSNWAGAYRSIRVTLSKGKYLPWWLDMALNIFEKIYLRAPGMPSDRAPITNEMKETTTELPAPDLLKESTPGRFTTPLIQEALPKKDPEK